MRQLQANPVLPMCPLCQTASCRPETLDDGWRLCTFTGLTYVTKDGAVGVVLETQRIKPTPDDQPACDVTAS